MLVTVDGMVMEVKTVAPENALLPMLVYPEIITIDILLTFKLTLLTIASGSSPVPLNTLYAVTVTPVFPPIACPAPAAAGKLRVPNLSNETTALVKPEFKNALLPMLVTPDGMVMVVKPDAPWNA